MQNVSLQQLLCLGFRLEPEQLWLSEQACGHGMALWVPPDPQHAASCTEGCGFPIMLENDALLVIPTPIKWDTTGLWTPDGDEDVEFDTSWPSVVARNTSRQHCWGDASWQTYRLWDVMPITSSEYTALKELHAELWDTLGLHDVALLAEIQYGEYSIWDELDGSTCIDFEKLEQYEALGLDAERDEYMEGVANDYMQALDDRIAHVQSVFWNIETVDKLIAEAVPGLVEPWGRLKSTSASGWRTVKRCFPPNERSLFMLDQRGINPWP